MTKDSTGTIIDIDTLTSSLVPSPLGNLEQASRTKENDNKKEYFMSYLNYISYVLLAK